MADFTPKSTSQQKTVELPQKPTDDEVKKAQATIYAAGINQRTDVLGHDYVANMLSNPSTLSRRFQELATQHAWCDIWTRPQLPLKTRSLLNIAMLSVMGKEAELKAHVRAAVGGEGKGWGTGVTEEEVAEVLMQVAVYAGMPTGMWAVKVVDGAFAQMKAKGESIRQ